MTDLWILSGTGHSPSSSGGPLTSEHAFTSRRAMWGPPEIRVITFPRTLYAGGSYGH